MIAIVLSTCLVTDPGATDLGPEAGHGIELLG
jgi:hypothetical protein